MHKHMHGSKRKTQIYFTNKSGPVATNNVQKDSVLCMYKTGPLSLAT
jgi:hypothetical protein